MFDLYVFSNTQSDRVSNRFKKIKLQYPHARLIYNLQFFETVLYAKTKTLTKMFWLLNVNVDLVDDFDFSWKPEIWDQMYTHTWESSDGTNFIQELSLWPKSISITNDDSVNRNIAVKVISSNTPIINTKFDIFVFSLNDNKRINGLFNNIRYTHPTAKLITANTLEENISFAQCNASTDMFWLINVDCYLESTYLKFVPKQWDRKFVHMLVADKNYNDIFDCISLWPSDIPQSIENEYTISNVKYVGVDKSYDILQKPRYTIIWFAQNQNKVIERRYQQLKMLYPGSLLVSDYISFIDLVYIAKSLVLTKMFWLVPIDYDIVNEFDLSWKPSSYDRQYVHVWINDYLDFDKNLSLWPSDLIDGYTDENILDIKIITDKPSIKLSNYDIFVYADVEENWVDIRFKQLQLIYPEIKLLINLSGIESIVSTAMSITNTKMFWLFDIKNSISQLFDMSWHPDDFDQQYVHIWPNTNDQTIIHGLSLWPSQSTKKIINEYTVNDIKIMSENVITHKDYDLFFISYNIDDTRIRSRFNQLQQIHQNAVDIIFTDSVISAVNIAQKLSSTKMFWLLDIESELNYNLSYFPKEWEQHWVYAWESENGKVIEQGLSLWPSNKCVNDEVIIDIKYINEIAATTYLPYDVFFISYNEPNADFNYQELLKIMPTAKRVNGITGINNAHKRCAELSTTEMFWTIDADTILDIDFNLSFRPELYDKKYLHLWYTRNPVNNLTYGYGGVKLWPRTAPLSSNRNWLDFTTSVGNIKIVDAVVSTTYFNTSEYDAWRSGFRESVKLSFNITNADSTSVHESISRLLTWLNDTNNVQFADNAKCGARQGVEYFISNRDEDHNIKLINDFNWLKSKYNSSVNSTINMPNKISKEDICNMFKVVNNVV